MHSSCNTMKLRKEVTPTCCPEGVDTFSTGLSRCGWYHWPTLNIEGKCLSLIHSHFPGS